MFFRKVVFVKDIKIEKGRDGYEKINGANNRWNFADAAMYVCQG